MKNALMRVAYFVKRHKSITVLFLFFMILCLCLSPFVAFSFPDNKLSENCFSITVDKYAMRRVNKMEIETPNGITIIEDTALIKDIVKCTLVATKTGSRASYEYSIRLYHGDALVRDMELSLYNNLIRVYKRDIKHYISRYDEEAGGQVVVSQELLDRIQQYLLEHGNTFGEPYAF